MDEKYINKILSFDKIYKQSELHGNSIDDNGELKRDPIKITSFETGFLYAKKLVMDNVKNK